MASTTTHPKIDALASRFKDMLDFRDARLVERRRSLWIMQVSLVANLHVVLYGNPGNAKSMTVDGILRHFPGIKLFKTQAFKASTPEQFLGPISIKAMEQDEYRRIITGKFADCDVAYIDELPRAPKPAMTAMQGGMVEREFDNGAGPQPIPLKTLVGTANHLPDDEELQAFFDRFTFKLNVKAPQTQEAIVSILSNGIERERNPNYEVIPSELLIEPAELAAMTEFLPMIEVPESFLDSMAELYSNLVGIGITPSLRRLNDLRRGVQAAALLDGRDEVMQDDIMIAADSMWSSLAEVDKVYSEVAKFASEWVRDSAELHASYDESRDSMTAIQEKVGKLSPGERPPKEITNEAIDLLEAQKTLRGLVEKQIALSGGRDVSALDQIKADMDDTRAWVSRRLLGGLEL